MTQQDNNAAGRRPDFIAYNVQESRDNKVFWNKVGAAWRHQDGQGYDLHLESMPLDGRVTLRELREERMQGYEDERQAQGPEQPNTRSRNRGRTR
ncbi:MAG: hypothetical protein ABFS45_03920 [Pseudomonadota bacterium]